MNELIRIGLIGYGRSGQAVARVLSQADDIDLAWIMKRSVATELESAAAPAPLLCAETSSFREVLQTRPVDMVVDFSCTQAIYDYGNEAAANGIGILSAVSNYDAEVLAFIADLATRSVVMSSPNITIGINYLLVASQLLQHLAPFTDIEIIEEHFRDKKETSGTALRIAATLGLDESKVNSIRVGGIVGHHEVVFGFPFQTVRLTHESISRDAFGTGALFAIRKLHGRSPGWYRYDDLIRESMLHSLAPDSPYGAFTKFAPGNRPK